MLPARREPITLQTADGLNLVAELALPEHTEPRATIICVHPLPTHGGMMDSHVFRKAAWRLPALAQMAVLRFNTRGTESQQGRSEGGFDDGVGERFDLAAAVEYTEFAELPRPWLVGWSFGTDLTLKYGLEPGVEGAILMSPPLRYAAAGDLARWDADGRPLLALIPETDDYLRYPEARERFAAVGQAEVAEIGGCGHLWVGKAEEALDRIVGRILPDRAPLPREWDGPMERGDTSAYADKTVAAFGGFLPKPEEG
ncbi:alpha/beta hydrolase [Glycomyces xiaoerkulensis]|uniref:alpha/beta hydrolase n=1 Tax=Glycomyces xiaoerkulensis TaxID=2038139 RepID=UPI000C265781